MAMVTILLLALVLLGSSVWVGLSLVGIGVMGLEIFKTMPVIRLLGQDVWTSLTSPELVALPLFILMGDILFHTRLAEQLFRGLAPWVSPIPGRLLHINVLGSTIFAAASGSSAATAATIGKITLPELLRRGYQPSIAMGSLASAGALGLLIPPSLVLIVYGVLTGVSVLELFTAGILPGLLLASCFSLYVMIHAILFPNVVPDEKITMTLAEKLKATIGLLPMVALILLVIGSMYGGIATPSEAAVMGVFGSLAIATYERVLTVKLLMAATASSVRTCAMLGLILGGALFLAKAMAFLGIPAQVGAFVASLHLSPIALIAVLIVFYVILGCFLDGTSMIVMTLPVTFPLINAAGYDPIWFGIFLVLVAEMGAITPPVGFNLFVVQNLTGASLGAVSKSIIPFFLVMVAFTLLITLFPQIVLWLPSLI
ncbi:tripartite ATP-independent transporter DctM subunit [Neorhizobium galegae]|uniref:TRAP transporter large permease n=1 Tax=Neorhizobium galegae TaxID=399 RepID=UPI001AE9FE42|nr:TRAP transporter large permease subunit [Neorhizobium galegae]MBP2551457.1 tripartite ATP-independent transporter DctM subunit [Neorhizobium galegae]